MHRADHSNTHDLAITSAGLESGLAELLSTPLSHDAAGLKEKRTDDAKRCQAFDGFD